MDRVNLRPRENWQKQVEDFGLIWHTSKEGNVYWNESACYEFDTREIDVIEEATATLYDLFLQAGQRIVDEKLYNRFSIPEWVQPLIEESWNNEPPALNYGRFDLGYNGKSPPKLFEFNCDTPTSLLEAAVVQWDWKEKVFPSNDQFNSIHDKLVAKWKQIAPYVEDGLVHFTSFDDASGEDSTTSAYLMDTARDCLQVDGIRIQDIGWDGENFVDLQNRIIETIYKLYPWEWLVNEEFGKNIPAAKAVWIEPIWKMMWSNKAILPILWEMFPNHDNLLWATAGTDKPKMNSYVCKPILAREGANIQIVKNDKIIAAKDGDYTKYSTIFQGLYDLPNFEGNMPVIGSWVVDGEPAGMGIREDGLITGNLSRFVPHIIR